MIGQPLLAGGERHGLGDQLGTDGFAPGEPHQNIRLPSRSDDGGGAAPGRAPRGKHFGEHAAASEMAAHAARHFFQVGIVRPGFADQFRVLVAARILGVQAGLVGEDHQGIGLDEIGHQRCQGVVVAEADLVGRDGVVLVDDRDHVELEQRAQRGARVQIALTVGQVLVGQQDLCGVHAVLAEARLVGFDQPHLPYRSGGLLFVQRMRAALPSQALHAFGDCAAGNQHDLLLAMPELRDLLRPARERGVV